MGQTLVDTLIGVGIFGISLLACFALIQYSTKTFSSQNDLSVANTILNYVAEDIKALKYENISTSTNYSALYTSGALRPTEMDKLTLPTITIVVTQVENYLKRVVITLNWQGAVIKSRSETATLFFTSKHIGSENPEVS